jgi:hypothetical protein
MLSLSYFPIPLLHNTITSTTVQHTLHQLTTFLSYGDPLVPLTAISITLMHWTHAYHLHARSNPLFTNYVLAGLPTLFMIPYTIILVFPVNRQMARLKEKAEKEEGSVGVEEVRKSLRGWNRRHVVRSLMPIVGVVVGLGGLLEEIRLGF